MYDLIYIYEFEGDMGSYVPTVADPDYVGFWKEAGYSFLFFRTPKDDLLGSLPVPVRSRMVIRHEDWESGAPLDVFRVGRIAVYPPWMTEPTGDGVRICIDPGMAFGSGFHPSSRGCLQFLDRLFEHERPRLVLDLGTGTGILGITALKLGADVVYAIDCNNLSIDMARKNRALNHSTDLMHLIMGKAEDFLHVPADLLIANIHFAVIDALIRSPQFYTKRHYILSGLLGTEGSRVLDVISGRLDLIDTWVENHWFSYLLKNRDA